MSYLREKFSSNFNSDNIIKKLNEFAKDFEDYLQVDILPYLVNTSEEEKREDFRNFISHKNLGRDVSISYIMNALFQAGMIQERENIEAAMSKEDLLLSDYADKYGLDQGDSSEDSYW